MTSRPLVFFLLLAAAGAAGCRPIKGYRAELGSLRIIRAVLPVPSSDSEATAYLILENRGAMPAALIEVRTPDARRAAMYGSGWPVSQVGVPARSSVRMTPSGYHIILTGLRRRLASGDTVALMLRFEPGGAIGVRAPVVAYFGTAGAQIAGQAGDELVWWCAILAAAGEDQMESAYFWVGVLLASLPVAVFGTIGFFLVRMFYRQRRANPVPAAGPLPEV
jgi:copper(I)-binding protein